MILKNLTNISRRLPIAFWISIYYGILVAAIASIYVYYFQATTLDAYQWTYLIGSTFSFYFYQKDLVTKLHQKKTDRNQFFEWSVFSTALVMTGFSVLQFQFQNQLFIFVLVLLGLLYHNHTPFFIFRRLKGIKNFFISLIWTLQCVFCFNLQYVDQYSIYLISLYLLLWIFCQSLVFDLKDQSADLSQGHFTISSSLDFKQLIHLRHQLLLICGLICLILFWSTKLSLQWFLLNLFLLAIYYFIFQYKFLLQNRRIIYITDLIFLVLSLTYLLPSTK